MEIPKGFCQCGCGGKTEVVKRTENKRGRIRGEPFKYLHGHNVNGRGENNLNYKGGRTHNGMGYILIRNEGHPRANKEGYVLEHILVAEKALGRPILPSESVHHIDFDRSNNAPGNLMVFKTKAMHTAFHNRLKAFEFSGHYEWRPCCFCHQYDDPINLQGSGNRPYHRSCENAYHRDYRHKTV